MLCRGHLFECGIVIVGRIFVAAFAARRAVVVVKVELCYRRDGGDLLALVVLLLLRPLALARIGIGANGEEIGQLHAALLLPLADTLLLVVAALLAHLALGLALHLLQLLLGLGPALLLALLKCRQKLGARIRVKDDRLGLLGVAAPAALPASAATATRTATRNAAAATAPHAATTHVGHVDDAN